MKERSVNRVGETVGERCKVAHLLPEILLTSGTLGLVGSGGNRLVGLEAEEKVSGEREEGREGSERASSPRSPGPSQSQQPLDCKSRR